MKTILLVEDDPNLGALYQEELSDIGYHTLRAASGGEAIAQMMTHRLDLVVIDIEMPGLDGIDGIEVMERMLKAQPHLPVIINSGTNRPKNSFGTGSAAAFVRKSGDLSELKAEVERILLAHHPPGKA